MSVQSAAELGRCVLFVKKKTTQEVPSRPPRGPQAGPEDVSRPSRGVKVVGEGMSRASRGPKVGPEDVSRASRRLKVVGEGVSRASRGVKVVGEPASGGSSRAWWAGRRWLGDLGRGSGRREGVWLLTHGTGQVGGKRQTAQ